MERRDTTSKRAVPNGIFLSTPPGLFHRNFGPSSFRPIQRNSLKLNLWRVELHMPIPELLSQTDPLKDLGRTRNFRSLASQLSHHVLR